MHVIVARNVNQAYEQGISLIKEAARVDNSRNGQVYRPLWPVTIMYSSPRERVLFEPNRDANPFFHLAEAMWMLAGRNDVKFLTWFVRRMSDFSDDGETFHGAYGYRWRNHFSEDQLPYIVSELKSNPNSRRAVLQMWSCESDLIDAPDNAKDLPCNLMAKFEINDGALDMYVFNRSNDMILGAMGANVVHFSILQEYLANELGVRAGRYWQISANMHAYRDTWEKKVGNLRLDHYDPYDDATAVPYPYICNHSYSWETELNYALDGELSRGYKNDFLGDVVAPVIHTWSKWSSGDRSGARHFMAATMNRGIDWTQSCLAWMDRRLDQ